MKVVYIRFQDFDKRFYLTSERELIRAFNETNTDAELIGVGKRKDEPSFVTLFSIFNKNHLANKILISLYLLKYMFTDTVIVIDNLSYLMAIPIVFLRRVFDGKVRVLMDIRGIPVETYKIYEYRKYNSSLIFAHKFLDGVTFITEGTRILTERMTKRRFENYRIYPSGFNDEIMKPVERDNKLAESLGITKDDFIIFYHGSISMTRGVKELVEAVELLKKEHKVKLFVIGGGEKEIIDLIKAGEGNIFMDPVAHDEIPKYISLADACVSPLPDILWWRVASSLKVMEYMACGKPIALTKMKAHTDVVPENNEGVSYFKNVSPQEIADSLKKIISEKEMWHSKRDIIVNHARTKFSYKRLASELLSYYKILSKQPYRKENHRERNVFKNKKIKEIKRKAEIEGVVYVRVQDVGRKFYITSERELVRSLNKLGVRSRMVAYGKAEEPDFVKLINAPGNNPTLVKIKMMLYNLRFRKTKTILIFGKLAYLTSIPLIIYRKVFGGKFRLMFDLRSIPVETKNKRNIVKFKTALRFSNRFFDGATFITEGTKRVCEYQINKKFRRYAIYPSGFNEEVMKPYESDSTFRKSLGISDKDKIVFYHGSISKNRGLTELADAIEILKKKMNVKLMIIGAGDEDIIAKIKEGKGNIFIGPVQYEEIPKYIAETDVCVSPLPDILWWRIASALKVMEYMACAKPIAMTRMKAHTDVVLTESGGVSYFDRVAPEEIADAIEAILKDMEKFNAEAKTLQKHARENFTYDSIAKKVLEFYEGFYEC